MDEKVTNEQNAGEKEPTVGEEPKTSAAPGEKSNEGTSPEAELARELERLQNELKEAKDTYLRMLAEYDNFRRRTAKEKENVWSDAVAETVKGLLPIADNLERAAAASGDAEAIAAGLTMTMTSLTDVFGKLGLTAFGAAGDAFDPNLHNAVMHVEDENLGEGVVAEVFQKGYRLGCRHPLGHGNTGVAAGPVTARARRRSFTCLSKK